MAGTYLTEAQEVRSSALYLSPVDLEGLENDLSTSCGSGYRYLSLKAAPLLDGSRSANPHPHCGRWAFDIDGLVFVTAIPCEGTSRARSMREAREVLDAALSRSIELAHERGWVAAGHGAVSGSGASASSPRPSHAHLHTSAAPGAPLRSQRDAALLGSPLSAVATGDRIPVSRPKQSGENVAGDATKVACSADIRTLDAALDAAHYTRVPQWVLSGSLPLTISERILIADILDVMGAGSSLSYKADRDRLHARTGLKLSTVTAALHGLASRGVLAAVPGARGRFTVVWRSLARLCAGCAEGARVLGAALTEPDIRRRLSDVSRSLAVPVWAIQLCGATQAALLLAKAWAVAHTGGDGLVWAAGTTLASWLPGNERSLRRARADLAAQGLTEATAQYAYSRLYNHGIARNKTVEFRVTTLGLARALTVRGIDFGADLTAVVSSFFAADADVRRDAALWDASQARKAHLRALRRRIAVLALQGDSAALYARLMTDAGSTSRVPAPWRMTPLRALLPAA